MRRFVVLVIGASLLDCRAPTEIVVDVTTDIPCASLKNTSITVGRYPAIEGLPPATVTTQCTSDGHIGSIVVVPASADNAPVAVRVVGGKGQDAESCKAPAYGPPAPTPTGCVVARRLLSFQPHDPLHLPIVLRDACVGVPCPDDQTCVDGTCKDATVRDPSLCSDPNACGEGTLGAADAGAPDAGDGGPDDAGPPDAGDGGPDDAGDGGPTDAGPDDAGDGGPTDTDAGDGGPDAGPPSGPVLEVAASAQGTSCARTMSGRIYCWGSNDSGKLGIGGATANAKLPVTQVMPGIPDASGMGLAQSFMCVLSPSAGVLCAGNGTRGQLGSGSMASSFTPSMVMYSSGATSIVVGANHACASQPALTQILCWGAGTGGQLGSTIAGGNMDTAIPGAFAVSSTTTLTVGAGGDTTCVVIQPGGNVRCWGSNQDGQLDRDTTTTPSSSQSVLVGVPAASDISVGTNAACALIGQQGQCWGRADGASITLSPPTLPVSPTYSDIVQVALGGSGGCARRATGNVICWGANDLGQLGKGSTDTANTYPPVDVPGISDAVHIARSADHVCVAHADGTVSCWGDNTFGQVSGDGVPTTTPVTTPTTVPIPK